MEHNNMEHNNIIFHFPEFKDKPNFYKDMLKLLKGDFAAPFKVQLNGIPVDLEYLKEFGGIQSREND